MGTSASTNARMARQAAWFATLFLSACAQILGVSDYGVSHPEGDAGSAAPAKRR